MFLKQSIILTLVGLGHVASAQNTYVTNARTGSKVLQEWYNKNTGLWNTAGWWNSANCMTALADLDKADTGSDFKDVYSNTLTKAQTSPQSLTKRYNADGMMETIYTPLSHSQRLRRRGFKGFLNDYFDDEGWWALAWIRAYDVTNDKKYLDMAASIFKDMADAGWTTSCGGGIWWDRKKTYVNAIANELFLSVAAHLANRSADKETYRNWALKSYKWFIASGMINASGTINDGLDKQCKTNKGEIWSYNQGVLLGGLVELTQATGDNQYVDKATAIATAAIKALSKDGVLKERCEVPGRACGADGAQFKGIFLRNLQVLAAKTNNADFKNYALKNADSIWAKDKNAKNQLGTFWTGPLVNPVNATTHSSALDAIVAAAALK